MSSTEEHDDVKSLRELIEKGAREYGRGLKDLPVEDGYGFTEKDFEKFAWFKGKPHPDTSAPCIPWYIANLPRPYSHPILAKWRYYMENPEEWIGLIINPFEWGIYGVIDSDDNSDSNIPNDSRKAIKEYQQGLEELAKDPDLEDLHDPLDIESLMREDEERIAANKDDFDIEEYEADLYEW
jgi:hypothetical protein